MGLTQDGKWVVGTVTQDGVKAVSNSLAYDGEWVLYYTSGGGAAALGAAIAAKLVEMNLV